MNSVVVSGLKTGASRASGTTHSVASSHPPDRRRGKVAALLTRAASLKKMQALGLEEASVLRHKAQ